MSKTIAFTNISIIFNPNSTGNGRAMAEDLKSELNEQLPGQSVKLMPTQYAGHAEELAYMFAKASPRPLIISASGDGGYHEVVNGIVRANKEGAGAVAGLLPAGNANDHYHATHQTTIVSAIGESKVQKVDLLKLATTVEGKDYERFAHSYIGFGLTPKVGKELNKVDLNRFNEILIVIKALFALRPVKILMNGKRRSYDSLIFSNVGKMSKVLTLAADASNSDGKFEVTIFRRRNKVRLLLSLLRASTVGLADAESFQDYHFRSLKRILVQLDGEIKTVDSASEVHITIVPKALECIV